MSQTASGLRNHISCYLLYAGIVLINIILKNVSSELINEHIGTLSLIGRQAQVTKHCIYQHPHVFQIDTTISARLS